MLRRPSLLLLALGLGLPFVGAGVVRGADFAFYGRSGDAIELNFASLPGVAAGATFSGLNVSGFNGHTVLTSDDLTSQAFASAGRLWVFANPARNTAGLGDASPAIRGFQGTLSGSLAINGAVKTFSVTVRPGYTGAGEGSVGQSLESLNRAANNPLYVAQQQQRLRYFGFVPSGGAALAIDGDFGPATDGATRTFQAAFVGGVNTTQDDVDGIIGPTSAAWLNAANAPTWDELVDPDPQTPGTFSTSRMIGAFDILPGPDPGTGARTGLTPQPERFATSWTNDLVARGAALAKSETGRTQRINALSTFDGYGSSCCHSTHLVGTDVDLYTNESTWNYGNGSRSAEEQIVINHASAFIRAAAAGRAIRFITSNDDIYDGIAALSPTASLYYDTSGAHQNHLHIDVGPPTRVAGLANLTGDLDLSDSVDGFDVLAWQRGLGVTYAASKLASVKAGFGQSRSEAAVAGAGSIVPEPATDVLLLFVAMRPWRRRRERLLVAGHAAGNDAPKSALARTGLERVEPTYDRQ
jgi:peptidoglycan hydrolase-like protein with peptidoglycan-binding domain